MVNATDDVAGSIEFAALSRKVVSVAKYMKYGVKTGLRAGINAAKISANVSKLSRITRIAGKASGVLAVVSVGIEVGLSFSELEERKAALQDALSTLDKEIPDARKDLNELKNERKTVSSIIDKILGSVSSPQSRTSWGEWVELTVAQIDEIAELLASTVEIIHLAKREAECTRALSLKATMQVCCSC